MSKPPTLGTDLGGSSYLKKGDKLTGDVVIRLSCRCGRRDRNVEIAIEISQLISAAALVATLAVVIWYTVKTSEMASATRDMALVSQQQRYDQQRPLLVPHGTPAFQDDNPNWLDWQAKEQDVTLRNVGSGPALNVATVLYGCESYVTSPVEIAVVRSDDAKDVHWTGWLGMPIAPNEVVP